MRKVALFFKVFFMTICLVIIVGTAFIFAYDYFTGSSVKTAIVQSVQSAVSEVTEVFEPAPEKTNFALLGLDEGGTRTDVMMVGQFDAETGKICLISVPRDTYAEIPPEGKLILEENGIKVPSGMKINAVSSYGSRLGKEKGIEFAVAQLEHMFEINIDYYAAVDVEAFRFVVDEVGGITFDVPQRMYYNDPAQNLYIDLYPGEQLLNGEQAEGLVRYRKADLSNPISEGYPMADITRVQVQQNFMKAFLTQVVNKKTIIANAPALLSAAIKYVKTDFTAADLPKYIKYAKNINADNIQTATIPGKAENEYFYPDEDALKQLTAEMFFGEAPTAEGESGDGTKD